jgi:prepilin-type N-terminal cleavage/methylation domain-containing protein
MTDVALSNMNDQRAFTLIELIAVVAVIAILVALLLPVLLRAKARAQSTVCKNHLNQIGKAVQMYVSDHNIYPPALGGGRDYQAHPELWSPTNQWAIQN